MKHLLLYLAFLLPAGLSAQSMFQYFVADDIRKMPSDEERAQTIRKLESESWFWQKDMFFDNKGRPLEQRKVDLAPFVDDNGETVFLVTEKGPRFPGGQLSFQDYLYNSLSDILAQGDESVQNSLYFTYIIGKDGKVMNVEQYQNAGDWVPRSYIQRCREAIEQMPDWEPGFYKGKPVKVKLMVGLSLRK